tara:strand:- start:1832 stop:2260 length:429 start_codon:yes stop_codon:yes gene_type:complete
MSQIDITSTLIEQLIDHEGMELKAYKDTVGKITIGVGRNLDDVGISGEEAMILLKNDIQRIVDQLDEKLDWWRELDPPRQRALISMGFNLGIYGLLKFKNTLEALKNKRWVEASDEMMDSKWASQVGRRAEMLSQIMLTGNE